MRGLFFFAAAGFISLSWVGIIAGGQTPSPPQARRVLILYSDERLIPANIIVDQGIHEVFTGENSKHIELYSEFLDVIRFPGEEQRQRQRVFFREKYQARPPDLVVAVGGGALVFLTERRAELFAGVPIVYCSIAGDPAPNHDSDSTIANVPVPDTTAPTVELMLHFHPDTRQVVVVSGSGLRDGQYAEAARKSLTSFENRVAFRWLSNLSMAQLRSELSHLPDHTLVLYLTMFQDAGGQTFTPRQALDTFAPASRVPIYGQYETYVGHGIVGGSIVTFEDIGRKAAQLGMRALAGEDAQAAARSESYPAVPMFDWRQLQRWKISEKQLPPGSIVRFKEATYWEKHHRIILTSLSLFILETLLIVALLLQLRRRRLAEGSLRESERRMSLAVDAADFGIWIRDLTRNEIWASEKWRGLFGFEPSERLELERILERLHPDDREATGQVLAKAIAVDGRYDAEFRLLVPNGGTRWISSHGLVEYDSKARPIRALGASLDITARKQAELEVQKQRNELAHLSRVTMLGELSGSMAHELNQPLTAILSNAQAAQRFLAHDNVNIDEVRAILVDIVAQDIRAGDIIHRLRVLLKKEVVQQQPLDVNDLVREVLKLARVDLLNHDVATHTALAPDLSTVNGDRVQLQQVLLNLVINACDAMNGNPPADRQLVLRTELSDTKGVLLSISDNGEGIASERLEQVFEPFFTTKAQGLGLGLSVCRTIITAHCGKLWAVNNLTRGTTFHLTLPVSAGGKP